MLAIGKSVLWYYQGISTPMLHFIAYSGNWPVVPYFSIYSFCSADKVLAIGEATRARSPQAGPTVGADPTAGAAAAGAGGAATGSGAGGAEAAAAGVGGAGAASTTGGAGVGSGAAAGAAGAGSSLAAAGAASTSGGTKSAKAAMSSSSSTVTITGVPTVISPLPASTRIFAT